jgi:CO/xanthine dehydrogenase FAD-binding subunit
MTGWPRRAPILREAALQIADPQVRYVGTVGGNVANGDPGNDMPGLMQCLDATSRWWGRAAAARWRRGASITGFTRPSGRMTRS